MNGPHVRDERNAGNTVTWVLNENGSFLLTVLPRLPPGSHVGPHLAAAADALSFTPGSLPGFYHSRAGFPVPVAGRPCSFILCPCHSETEGTVRMPPSNTASPTTATSAAA